MRRRHVRSILNGLVLAIVLTGCEASAGEAASPVRSLIERRSERVVLQQWDLSCGAAALATLLRFGADIAVTEREVALGLMGRKDYLDDPNLVRARQGFSLLDMKRYVARWSLSGEGLGGMTQDDLERVAPAIVPLSINGFSHFVVFRGVKGGRVLLADPAFGNRTMTWEQFERAWAPAPRIGRIGFVIRRTDGAPIGLGRLAPRDEEFVSFN